MFTIEFSTAEPGGPVSHRVLFGEPRTAADSEAIVNFVTKAGEEERWSRSLVLFVGTKVTRFLVLAIAVLHKSYGVVTRTQFRVVVRDNQGHERPSDNLNHEDVIAESRLHGLIGYDQAVVRKRSACPTCSTLVREGDFWSALCVVARPDAAGLLMAMKALGVSYPELECDAAILEGPPANWVYGSPLCQVLVNSLATVTPFTVDPVASEAQTADVFTTWAKAIQGDGEALAALESRVAEFEPHAAEA